jgi:mannose-6-phosphate isomerase-like protein (cupin superfamily)
MKIVKKNQITKFEHGSSCVANEYPVNDSDINVAIIELNGRYPEKGFAMNEISKELAYVMEGSGSVIVEGSEVEVCEGDLVMVYPGEKFCWSGKMKLFMPCTPAWNPAQYKTIE